MMSRLSKDLRSTIPPTVVAAVSAQSHGSCTSDINNYVAAPLADRPLRPLLGAVKQLIREDPGSVTRTFLSRAVAHRLLGAKTHNKAAGEQLPLGPKLSTRQVQVVRDYIDANLTHTISVENLAASIGMCRAQFARRYKISTGMTPHQAVAGARIRNAKMLLANRTLSIDKVAKSCGFSSASHLASVFRHNVKTSPSVYRAQTALTARNLGIVPDAPGVRCSTHNPSSLVTAAQPAQLSPAEYRLEETTIRPYDDLRIVASSGGLGWKDLFAATTDELPHEILHRVVPDVWLATGLTPVDILRVGARCDYSQVLPKHSITITAPGEAMYDKLAAPLKVAYVYLRRAVIDDVAKELFTDSNERREIASAFCSTDGVLQRIIASIRMSLEDPPGSCQLKIDYLSQALAARLIEKHSVVGPVRATPETHSFNSREIGQIIDYVNENLSSNLSVNELAKLVGLGRAQFILRFKSTTSVTPHQFVILRRIWRAREMLIKRGAEQHAIALHCGFANQSHFIATFKKIVGMTPHEYRLSAM